MTKKEIIEETVAYYTEDPSRRAVSNFVCPRCYYEHPSDSLKRCAVGRCMTDEALDCYGQSNVDVIGLRDRINQQSDRITLEQSLDSILLERYHGHDISFWKELQLFHDQVNHWTESGLTPQGIDFLNHLTSRYNDTHDSSSSDEPAPTA